MENKTLINIGKDFSDTPVGRYLEDGGFSGQRFREEFLAPALEKYDKVDVDISDAEGYGSSFLDEAFGGLVRDHDYSYDQIREKLNILCSNDQFGIYVKLIWFYIEQAQKHVSR
jgi:hypothetical protein